MTEVASSNSKQRWPIVAIVIVLIVAVVGSLAWFMLARRGPAPIEEPLRIGLSPYLGTALLQIADEQGFFADEGLTVELVTYPNGRAAWQAALAGEVDVGTPFDAPAVLSAMAGDDIRILATLSFQAGETLVVGRTDRGIVSASDLAGMQVGLVEGSTSEYTLSVLLESEGLSFDDIVRVSLTPAETSDALIEGRVDAIAVWTPHWQVARDALGVENVTLMSPLNLLAIASLAATSDVVAARPDALEALLRGLLRAEALVYEQPDTAFDIVLARIGPPETDGHFREQWADLDLDVTLSHRALAALQNEAEWFATLDRFGPAPEDFLDVFEPSILRAVDPSAVTLPERP